MKKTEGYIRFEKERDELFENESFPDMGKQYTFQDMRCAWIAGNKDVEWAPLAIGIAIGAICVCIIFSVASK